MKKSERRTRARPPARDSTPPAAEPIAVVGMSCRFAGDIDSPEALWRLLIEENDAITDAPPPWRRGDGHYRASDRATAGRTVSIAGGYLTDVAGFDAEFFGITPREAADMDPQQRLALELAWEAFEDAGIRPDRVQETGVYFANKFNDYRAVKLACGATAITPFTSTGDVEGVIANRVSYTLGFDGPSMTVNASCAGSLVAVHLACQALRAGESALAIAGGVQLNLIPETTIGLSALGVLSPHGRSRAFDASADGYVRGEGGAVVVLKPLTQAQRDGDRIYCTLLGSATNNNGRHHAMPASSATGQGQLLRRACARAGVDPATIDYVEAHGTGTAVGDRAELSALAEVYGAGRSPATPLMIGSIKTNIGHTEAASGMAGLLKVALALSHDRIPRSLHFDSAPADLDVASAGLRIADSALPWPRSDRPPRAGVSAFGFGGSNAHVIAEATPAPSPAICSAVSERLVVLSAHTQAALRAHARRVRDHLVRDPGIDLGDLAHTLATRTPLPQRIAIVADEVGRVVEFLDDYLEDDHSEGDHPEGGYLEARARTAAEETNSTDCAEEEILRRVLSAALRPGTVAKHDLMRAAAVLFRRGVEPDWAEVNPPGHPIALPTYPFQRKRHWVAPRLAVSEPDITAPDPAVPQALSGGSAIATGDPGSPRTAGAVSGSATLAALVTAELAEVIGIASAEIDTRRNFDRFGVGSVHAVELSARLTTRLGIAVPAAIIWGCPTVELLVTELETRLLSTDSAPGSTSLPVDPPAAMREPDSGEEVLSTAELLALGRELLGP
ncbi:beta-ketoacyl synthase N-terminal-like domain-containing protein [Nocardia sp. 004]|uniref:beta-ketoacyl synthase N-terminal-like domain-containing protein n=1 Tax=Nocardia sp. 004 TaxID=3385978 RepID=UPI0039A29EF8